MGYYFSTGICDGTTIDSVSLFMMRACNHVASESAREIAREVLVLRSVRFTTYQFWQQQDIIRLELGTRGLDQTPDALEVPGELMAVRAELSQEEFHLSQPPPSLPSFPTDQQEHPHCPFETDNRNPTIHLIG